MMRTVGVLLLFACHPSTPEPLSCPRLSDGAPRDPSVYDTTAVSPTPRVIFSPKPTDPRDLQVGGVSGQVWFDFIVDQSGGIEQNSFRMMSSTDPRFTEAAIPTMLATRFCPGLLAGVPVRTRVQRAVTFRIGT
jgi:hypothetical protein